MATGDSSVQVGPVPFKDVEDDGDMVTALPERPSEEHVGLVSALPCCTIADMKLRCYQGFWLREGLVPAAAALQRRFEPRPSDVIVASLPKCGTTWLVALAFATLARRAYPPGAADHPLRRLNPHQCLPFLEGLFAGGREGKLDALVGLPFSAAEEEGGVVGGIVELCSLDSLRGMEANKAGYVDPRIKFPREALFRKGVADDWKSHMTPEMARRMDGVAADKLRATGLAFP